MAEGTNELTPAASLAWRLAAAEAAGARQELIECGHFLIGILSVDKFVDGALPGLDLPAEALPAVRSENQRIQALLASASLQANELRRSLREAVGSSTHDHAGRPMSRSPALRAAFRRAAQRAGRNPVGCLHFVAALVDPPDPPVARALARSRSSAAELLKWTLAALGAGSAPSGVTPLASAPGAVPQPAPAEAAAGPLDEGSAPQSLPVGEPSQPPVAGGADPIEILVRGLVRSVRERRGVTLRITPDAAAFLAKEATGATQDVSQQQSVAASLLEAPLASLESAGKLGKHPVWQVVYEEGGLYVLPDE